MTTIKDFWAQQSEEYDFIQNTTEHLRIANHGTEKERVAAVDRYMEACRINYMSVSEAIAWWRFTAPTEEMFHACLPVIRKAEATAAAAGAAAEEKEEVEDDVEGLVLERYGDLACPACGLQYSTFCNSEEELMQPCNLCNPQYIVDYKQWLHHVDDA
jgi:hypothetical protein